MTDKNDKKKTEEELSAYEKAGLSGDDPRCVPIKLDGPAPEGREIVYPEYSAAENETWKTLFARQLELLPGRACREYLDGVALMDFPADTWVKIEITAVVGTKGPHTFDLTVSVPGQEPQKFEALPFGSNEFTQLTWFGFSSTGNERQTFYVDDLRLNTE